MAQTGIRIKTDIENVYQRIIITTENNKLNEEHSLDVRVSHCDKDWGPHGESLSYVRLETEEEFHKNLRIESAKKKQLVTQFSTNPEWNPEDYVLLDDQFDTKDATQDSEYQKELKEQEEQDELQN